MKRRASRAISLLPWALAASFVAAPASAVPFVYAGKGGGQPTAHAAHVVVMKKGDRTVVTALGDYSGPMEDFALVTVVPGDVTEDRLRALKRDFVDRVEMLTAPRFAEFWEKDPCDPEPQEQEWERSRKATSDTDFLGGKKMFGGSDKKVAEELFTNVGTQFKDKEGEHEFVLLGPDQKPTTWLSEQGYKVPGGLSKRLQPYLEQGMRVLISKVNASRLELTGGSRAQLSPIQFWTEEPYETLPTTLGTLALPKKSGMQEVQLYMLHPESRFESKNYPNVFPPTNIAVQPKLGDIYVKERIGSFYAGIHDLILEKQPKAVLNEYAWSSEGCGQPCATPPLEISELLTMGGHVFEELVPEEEKSPEPPELTEEEEKKFKASLDQKPPQDRAEAKKQFEEDRQTVARVKALVGRHKYIVSRLHYRYDADTMTEDAKIGTGPAVQGGTGVPKGPKGELPTEVEKAGANEMQVRFVHLHPSKTAIKCENPKRWRWGKRPRTNRERRKTWVATDLTRRNRDDVKPAAVVETAVPSLGLVAVSAQALDAGPAGDAGSQKKAEDSDCGCRTVGGPTGGAAAWMLAGILGLSFFRRRR